MLLSNFNLLATAPGGVARLREMILTLAMQGKLVPQDSSDEPAKKLLQKIRVEKDRLVTEGKIKRDKPLAAIDDEEKPYRLPVGWEWVRLGDIGYTNIGLTYSPTNISEIGIPVLRSNNVQAGKLDLTDLKRVNVKVKDSVLVAEGDLLICARNGSKALVGKTALITGLSEPMAFGAFMAIFRSEVNFYVLHFINSSLFRRMIADVNTTTINQITQENLRGTAFPLPPVPEQVRIVARVEALMRVCDALEVKGKLEAAQHAQLVSTLLDTLTGSDTPEALAQNWQRLAAHFDLLLDRPQAIDAFEQTILQLAVRGRLVPQDPSDEPASVLLQKIRAEKDRLILEGKIKRDKPLAAIADEEKPFEVPAGWRWVRMGDLINASEAGWSPTCIGSPRRPGFWGVLKISAVSWGAFDENANKELPPDLFPRPEYEVNDGDFLLSRANTEELVARSVVVGTVKPQLMLSDKIIRLDVSSLMNRMFLNLSNNASHSRVHYIANASGTSSSMKNVSREVVLKTPVPLPPAAEQSRIVARIEELRRLCAELRQRLSASQTTQAHLAEALVESVAG